ncbi:MAG: methyltransferase [Nitrospiraceae bacterium]|nr:methyltransferase [Nitrospiraceae bacterium]
MVNRKHDLNNLDDLNNLSKSNHHYENNEGNQFYWNDEFNNMIGSKSNLEIILSKLKTIDDVSITRLEQYQTESSIAAEILWFLHMHKELSSKIVADFGCGAGIFGIGALLMGAKFCYFIDVDERVLAILKENLEMLKINKDSYEIINDNVSNFKRNVDMVIENPPFGTKVKHADRVFLGAAFNVSDNVISLHKSNTSGFVEAFSRDNGFYVKLKIPLNMRLKNTMKFHKSKMKPIDVSMFWIKKVNDTMN